MAVNNRVSSPIFKKTDHIFIQIHDLVVYVYYDYLSQECLAIMKQKKQLYIKKQQRFTRCYFFVEDRDFVNINVS